MAAIIDYIEVEWRPVGAAQWQPLPHVQPGAATVEVHMWPGQQYEIRARNVSVCGAVSDWVSVNHTPADPADAPKAPLAIAAAGMADGIHVTITPGDSRAHVRTEVNWAADANDAPGDWFELTPDAGGMVIDRVTDGSLRWYQARHVDSNGNVSAWVGPTSARAKTVADGANVGVPSGNALGGQFGAYIVADDVNKLLKYVDLNDTATQLATVPFIHPDGTAYSASGTPTPFADPDGGKTPCFLAFVGADESRFAGAANPDLIVIRKLVTAAAGWQWNDGAAWHDFTADKRDAVIAQINVAATGEPIGAFPIAITNIVAATVATKPIGATQPIDDPGTYKNNHTDQVVSETVDGQQVGLSAGTTHLQTFVPKTGLVKQILVHETDGSFVRFGTADDTGWGALSRTYDQGHKPNLDNDVLEGTTYGRTLQSRLNSGKPLIDFSETFHLNKTQDYIADGASFRRVGSAYVDTANRINALFDPSVSIVYDGATLGDGIRRARSGLDSSGNVARTVPDVQVSESSVTQHQDAINAGNTQNVGSQPATAVQSTVQKSTRNVVTVGRVSGSGTTAGRVLLASKLK